MSCAFRQGSILESWVIGSYQNPYLCQHLNGCWVNKRLFPYPQIGSTISLYRGLRHLCSGSDEEAELFKLIDASVARGDGNEGSTAVRHYKKWSAGRGDAIFRPLDPMFTPLKTKRKEVFRIARFALFLVRTQGVSASSASGYISTVNAWHRRRCSVGLAGDAKLSISRAVLLGWARSHPPPRGVFQRLGITPQHLALGMDAVLGRRGSCSALNQNIRACLTACFAGLLRACEACFQDGKPASFQAFPFRLHLSRSKDGVITILIREAKRNSLRGVSPVASTPVQFYPGGKLIDPVLELESLLLCDPSDSSCPLFRDPHTNQPLKVSFIRDMLKRVAAAAGLDPAFFGAHSLRCDPHLFRFTTFPPHPYHSPSTTTHPPLVSQTSLRKPNKGSNTLANPLSVSPPFLPLGR